MNSQIRMLKIKIAQFYVFMYEFYVK